MTASYTDFFEPLDLTVCPLDNCLMEFVTGEATHSSCVRPSVTTKTPNGGKYDFDTNGCTIGASQWRFGCKYAWPEGGITYTYTP